MYKYVATCSFGTEELLENEIKKIDINNVSNIRKTSGAVEFSSSLKVAYTLCLWSRIASRVLLHISDFECEDTDDLYNNSYKINWAEYLNEKNSFLIKGSISNGVDINSQYALFRMKDAIVDWFQANTSGRPSIAKVNADHYFHFHINKNQHCTLYLDLVGEALHKRAYRTSNTQAPLKETLANAILQYGQWTGDENNKLLIDPMCGSGTLLIEAALMSAHIAPGASRKHYSMENWKGHDVDLWNKLRKKANESKIINVDALDIKLFGFDSSQSNIDAARSNAKIAGVEELICFKRSDFHNFAPPEFKDILPASKHMITNPPYGERLGEVENLRYFYKCIGRKIKQYSEEWNVSIFSNNNELIDQLGLPVKNRKKLFNGPIKCQLAILDTSKNVENSLINPDFENKISGGESFDHDIPMDFSNRLTKNYKVLKKWILKNNIDCYRLYDKDMPEYNVVIDVYADKIHLQEYKPPKTVDPDAARKRLKLVISSLINIFGVNRNNIFLKQRERQKGNKQYSQLKTKKKYLEISEGNLFFLVNFTDYLDVGIFLDHRYIRNYIRTISKDKHFLNLFSYTATASIFAASGGAKSTTSVDLSSTYSDWAISNFLLNGFSLDNNFIFQDDILIWLKYAEKPLSEYDIIFVDPPTFSNSKKLSADFNVQDDHVELLLQCKKILAENGQIIFSNNFKDFILDESLSSYFNIENISELSISPDFNRNKKTRKKIHHCWILNPL